MNKPVGPTWSPKTIKIIRVVVVVCFVLLLMLTIKFWTNLILNELSIKQYQNNIYDETKLKLIMVANFPEGYIAHYNLGNIYYNHNNLNAAKEEFLIALETTPDDRVCDVRLNLGLTISAMLDADSDQVKDELLDIASMLLEDGCAAKDGNGRHTGAQRLYDEIMKLIENADPDTGGSSDPDNDPETDDDGDDNEIQTWLNQQAEEAQYEHNNDYYSQDDYEYYDGATW